MTPMDPTRRPSALATLRWGEVRHRSRVSTNTTTESPSRRAAMGPGSRKPSARRLRALSWPSASLHGLPGPNRSWRRMVPGWVRKCMRLAKRSTSLRPPPAPGSNTGPGRISTRQIGSPSHAAESGAADTPSPAAARRADASPATSASPAAAPAEPRRSATTRRPQSLTGELGFPRLWEPLDQILKGLARRLRLAKVLLAEGQFVERRRYPVALRVLLHQARVLDRGAVELRLGEEALADPVLGVVRQLGGREAPQGLAQALGRERVASLGEVERGLIVELSRVRRRSLGRGPGGRGLRGGALRNLVETGQHLVQPSLKPAHLVEQLLGRGARGG